MVTSRIERIKKAVERIADDHIYCNKRGKVCVGMYAETEDSYQYLQQYAINALYNSGFVGYVTIQVLFKIRGEVEEVTDRHFITLPNFTTDDISTSGGTKR